MRNKVFNVIKILLLYLLIYLLCTIIFISLFHLDIFKNLDVFMYKGIIYIILTGVLASIIMAIAKKNKFKDYLDNKDIIMMFIGYCCVNMVLFTLIPVTVERSISVFMLSYMDSYQGETYNETKMTKIFEDIYVDEFKAFDKRFNEQIVTGTIERVSDDEYIINDNGKFIVKMFRTVAKWFNMDTKLVYPKHSNENSQ